MNRFKYKQPQNLEEASQWLANPNTKALPIAGGSDLLGLIKHHIEAPEILVNLKSIDGLSQIKYDKKQGLTIGSQVKIAEIAEHKIIRQKYPVLAEAANQVASPQLRNMGTLGGNLCQRPRCWYFRGDFDCLRKGGDTCFAIGGENKYHCIVGGGPCYIVHPSDTAVALLALDAEVSIYSNGDERIIPIDDLYILPEDNVQKENILEPGAFITEIIIPDPENTQSTYTKFKERAAWDFAVVSIAIVLQVKGNKVNSGKLAFGGVAPRPWIDKELNQRLIGLELNENSIDDFVSAVMSDAEPMEKNQYKILLARNLIKKILQEI